jgi:hypothetical protein
VASLIVALVLVAPATSASGGGSEIRKEGKCSGTSTWKLKVKKDDALIEQSFEVDSNVVGQTWRVVFKDNGVAYWSGYRKTLAPSGAFEVTKFHADSAGSDFMVARATNVSTGEVCRGAATI